MKITKSSDARLAQKEISFCYICGKELPIYKVDGTGFERKSNEVNEDHVLASSMFPPVDRDFPIKLKVHKICHGEQGVNDQKMSELMQLLWDPRERANLEQLNLEWAVDTTGRGTASYWADDIPSIIFRWIRGLHAALYREFIPSTTKRSVLPPFQEMRDGKLINPHYQFYQFANQIIRNRLTGNIDEAIFYNEKCKYQCVWGKISENEYNCYFALDINGWSIFSGAIDGNWRTCLGVYTTNRLPMGASLGSSLLFGTDVVSLDLFPDERKVHIGDEKRRKTVTFRGIKTEIT